MIRLKCAELFAGIGGFSLGFERAGIRVAWQCEIEPYAQGVLERHWPHIPVYQDVRQLKGGNLEKVQILAGGFPCQDISTAGRGAGIQGGRSGLWSEFARLVGELEPRYVVVENVAALKAKGRGLGRVLADLAALGYDAEWDCLPASAFGAPHQRDRIWIVAYPARDGETGPAPQTRTERERAGPSGERSGANGDAADALSVELRQQPGRRSGTGRPGAALAGVDGASRLVADTEGEPVGTGLCASAAGGLGRRRSGDSRGQDGDGSWAVEPGVGRVADGVPNRVDRLSALGNALVPQIAEWIGSRIVEWEELNA